MPGRGRSKRDKTMNLLQGVSLLPVAARAPVRVVSPVCPLIHSMKISVISSVRETNELRGQESPDLFSHFPSFFVLWLWLLYKVMIETLLLSFFLYKCEYFELKVKGSCVLCKLEMFYFSSLPVLEGVSLVWFFSNMRREA